MGEHDTKEMPDPVKLLTVADLAKALPLGRRTIWRQIKDGALPRPIHIGRAVRFRRSTIEKRP